MEKKKILVFDFDGVLYDSVNAMHEYTMNEFKNVTREEVINLHKENIHDALRKATWEKAYETEDERLEIRDAYLAKKALAPLYEGTKELLEILSDRYTLMISTSSTENACFPLLEKEGIGHFFAYVATKETHPSKVEKFRIISELFHTPLSQMIFITDTVGDIKEAGVVGIPTIAVSWGVHNETHFNEEHHPHLLVIVHSVKELEAYLMRGEK
jgi:phosphoglycolate phosphatase-like HAD superfamily hydrolase